MIARTLEPTLGPAEPAYRAHFFREDAAQVRATVLLVFVLALIGVLAEQTVVERATLGIYLITRGFLVSLCAGSLVALTRIRSAAALDRLSAVFLAGIVLQFLVGVGTRPTSPLDGIGFVLIVVGSYLLIPTSFPVRATAAAAATVGFLVVAYLFKHEHRGSFYAVYIPAAVALHSISGWASARIYSQRRRQYAAQETLRGSLRERDALIQQLRQTRQMASLGRLAAGVAHDFNNILNAMLVPVDLLATDQSSTEQQQGEIQVMRDAVNRGQELTQQLLAFSRHRTVAPQTVSLNDLVTDTHRLLARTLGGTVRIEMRLHDELAPVSVDPGQVRQILLNLALNARDAMEEEGTLTIATRNESVSPDPNPSRADVPPGRYAVLSVADTGVGMDEETLKRIFEPFFTTKAEGTGTGLGLAIVYGVVEQSGGYIHVSSAPGQGTTFDVFFPALPG